VHKVLNRKLTDGEMRKADKHLAVPLYRGELCPGSPLDPKKEKCQHRQCNLVLVEFGRGVTQRDKIPVSRLSIRCLRLGEWLNDEVINYVFAQYQARNDAGDGLLPCYFFSTMFYTNLMDKGYKSVRRWTAAKHKIDIFTQALIFIPIHCGSGRHWTLAVVNSVDMRFEYFDSCGGPDNGVLTNVRSYVAAEMKDKWGAIWDDSGWTDHVWKKEDGTPQQGWNNGDDCGLFMLKTADLLAQDAHVDVVQVLPP